ncbi:MAG: DNA polymerase III subunit [Planctomycetota bacterium]|jgi:DNA polymerase-3 subunit delta'
MSLREIFCQDKALGVLQRAYGLGRMAHAYVFAGAEGVGKFKTAREWAKMLLCLEPVSEGDFADSCGSCESCRMFEADSHPDFGQVYKELLEFTKDGKGRTIPIDLPKAVIQEFLIDKVSVRPTLSPRKVFVVREGEKLNAASQNSLLKVLEEPPGYCCIILLCTRLEKLLPTTRSRCQTIRFGPISEGRIIEKLRELGIDEEQVAYWAGLAEGSLGRACLWAQLELGGAGLYETKRRVIESLCGFGYSESVGLAERLLTESKRITGVWVDLDKNTSKSDIGRRAQKTLVRFIISGLHDAMTLNLGHATQGITNFDQKGQIEALAGDYDGEIFAEKIADCYRALRQIESAVNEKLIFERLLLNVAGSGRIGSLG